MIYDQPFCIINSKGKFHPRYQRYLPPLELPDPDLEPAFTEFVPPDIQQLIYSESQLRAEVRYLSRKLMEHIDKQKRKAYSYT